MAIPTVTVDGGIFFPIEHSVGRGGRNLPDDVQRIQLLLNVVHLDPSSAFRMGMLLRMDGVSGPRTEGAILAYQTFKRDQGIFPSYAVDGRVDATHAALWAGPGGFGYSTLFNLNYDFMMALPRVDLRFIGAYAIEPFYTDVIQPLQRAGVL